jgi:hypothetical protein
MRKFIMILAVTCLTIIMQSCAPQNHVVTVIGLHQDVSTPDHVMSATDASTPLCDVLTHSGDTVVSRVPQGVLLENAFPFKALMVKSSAARYGYVQRAIGTNAGNKTNTKKIPA